MAVESRSPDTGGSCDLDHARAAVAGQRGGSLKDALPTRDGVCAHECALALGSRSSLARPRRLAHAAHQSTVRLRGGDIDAPLYSAIVPVVSAVYAFRDVLSANRRARLSQMLGSVGTNVCCASGSP